MSFEKEIEVLNQQIKIIENEIEKLQHPEEKLRSAQEEYNAVLIERAEHIINCYSKIDRLSEDLNKPWNEYSDSPNRGRFKTHPIANEIARFYSSIDMDWSRDYFYTRMIERKDMLDNFKGLMSDAEKRLQIARDELAQCEKLRQIKEAKKRSKKQKESVIHTIRISRLEGDEIYLNPDDIKEVALNGARGLTIVKNEKMLSIQKSILKDILSGFPYYDVKVGNGLTIQYQKNYYRFFWQQSTFRKRIPVYSEAFLDVSKKEIEQHG